MHSSRTCRALTVLILVAASAGALHAGTGTITAGPAGGPQQLNLRVHFERAQSDVSDWQEMFKEASNLLYAATNKNLALGTITMSWPPASSSGADVVIKRGTGTACAHVEGLGQNGLRTILYEQRHKTHHRVLVHELGHYVFGLYDEYLGFRRLGGPDRPWEMRRAGDSLPRLYDRGRTPGAANFPLYCVSRIKGNPAMACLMNATQTTPYKNFCASSVGVGSSHNSGLWYGGYWYETKQQFVYEKACWDLIADKLHCRVPASVPDVTDDAPSEPTFKNHPRNAVGIVADRSADATGTILAELQSAAKAGVQVARSTGAGENPTEGQMATLVSFGGGVSVDRVLTGLDTTAKNGFTSAIDGWTAGGTAAIGDALRAALNAILAAPEAASAESRSLILVSSSPNASGESPTGVILDDLVREGVQVFVLAVGPRADRATLETIARRTLGEMFVVDDPDDLDEILPLLVAGLSDGGRIASFEGSLGGPGEVTRTVDIDPGARLVSIALLSTDATLPLTMSVTMPGGQVIDPVAPPSGVEVLRDGEVTTVNVKSPAQGTWTLKVEAAAGVPAQAYHLDVFGQESDLSLDVDIENEQPEYAHALKITATPLAPDGAVAGAQVTAGVTRPDGSVVALTLLDDGNGATSGDAVADDGEYTAYLRDYRGNGTYRFTVNVTNTNGTIAPVDTSSEEGEPLTTTPVAPFTRSMECSACVTGIPAGMGAGLSPVAGVNTSSDGSSVTLTWVDGNTATTAYRIERSSTHDGPWTLLATILPGQPTYTDPDASGLFEAFYRITAASSDGASKPSAVVCARLAVIRALSSTGTLPGSKGCAAHRGPATGASDLTLMLLLGIVLFATARRWSARTRTEKE